MSCSTRTPRTLGPGRHGHLRGGRTPPEYHLWSAVIQRCLNPNGPLYPDYGGRGITVCDRWLEADGFPNFLADVGRRPSDGLTLHRVDNDRGYEPGNVVWADWKTQARDRRSNRLLTHDGRTMPLAAWAEEKGMKAGTLLARLRAEWTVAEALDTPVASRKPYAQWAQLTKNPRKRGPKPKPKPSDPPDGG